MPNLPAPYVSPWKDLARNLRALRADLGLRMRELWRRNREGDLSVPAFWPADLAPLFWPVLLTIVVALVVSAAVKLNNLRVPAQLEGEQSGGPTQAQVITTEPASPKQLQGVTTLQTPIREIPAIETSLPDEPVAPVEMEEVQPPVALQLDPLLDLFLDGSAPDGVLNEARPEPADNRLVLCVTEAWWELGDLQRSELAKTWQERSHQLGYSELQLVNVEDRLLARSARVGDGMILFNNVPPA